MTLKPWLNYDTSGKIASPFWWSAYNKCKHERTEIGEINGERKEYYKFANLENTLSALAGLYQTNLFSYRILAKEENKKIVIPLPGSRLFTLLGNDWSDVIFFKDFAMYIEDNCLYSESSNIYY